MSFDLPLWILRGGVQYLLDDEFSIDLAAGAVNGTPAVPGPGTRVVIDTDVPKHLSLAGGLASFTPHTVPAQGDPGYSLDPVIRIAGRLLIIQATPSATNTIFSLGFDSDTLGYCREHGIYFDATASLTVYTVGGGVTVGTYTAITQTMALVLRATGAHVFRKVSSQWILLWSSAVSITTPLYPCIRGNTAIFTSDFIRIPAQLWTPTPIASDSFNRANATLDASLTDGAAVEEIGGAGLTWTATTWTIATNVALNTPTVSVTDVIVNGAFAADTDWTHGANWSIALGVASIAGASSTDETAAIAPLTANTWYQVTWTNSAMTAGTIGPVLGTLALKGFGNNAAQVVTGVANGTAFAMRGVAATGSIDNVTCKAITLSTLFATVPCNTPDVLVELPITDSASNAGGKQVGIVVNLDSAATPANFIIAYLNGNSGCQLDEYVAGVRTAKIAATTITYSAGAKLKVVRSGTSCACYYNELQVGTTQTMTANVNTAVGMFSTQATPTVNDIAVWARGTNGEWSALDAF